MKNLSRLVLWGVLFIVAVPVVAAEGTPLELERVVEDVFAIVGPLGDRTPENLGNNATFGLVVTTEGVVLVDPGGTYKGAEHIAQLVGTVTDKPVKYVINTGGQDHRWLGNDYFKRRGARVIASKAAVADQKQQLNDILVRLSGSAGEEAMEGTVESYADIVFDDRHELTIGGTRFEIIHTGVAHTPGDSFVWLPEKQVVFSGDIIYTERLLSVTSSSNSASWVRAFEALESLEPRYVVPGHGAPTTIDEAREATYDYLTSLRASVGDFIEGGGEIYELHKIDLSRFSHLRNFEQLNGRNVQQVFQEMEW